MAVRQLDPFTEQWLLESDAFAVVTETGRRIGRVAAVLPVLGGDGPGTLLVRSGVLGQTLLAIPVDDVVAVTPRRERVVVRRS